MTAPTPDLDQIKLTILHAREDAEGWYNEARPLVGRQHFAFAGAGRMLNDTADAAEQLLIALAVALDRADSRVSRVQYEEACRLLRERTGQLTDAQDRADRAKARLAEVWDEGVKWAAIECGAIDRAENAFHLPGENPYRSEATA